MKNNIKITNLTQVFIGSGDTLQHDMDFIVRRTTDGEGSDVFIIDPDLIGRLIGDDKALFQKWMTSIEKRETKSFFEIYLKSHKPSEYSKRRITNYAGDNPLTIKEYIHDGFGRPYIPGSSIKGAIRTAIISYLANKLQNSSKEKIIAHLNGRNGQINYTDEKGKRHKTAEDFFLGDNPNENLMRFIVVGDAFYNKSTEIAVTQISLNERERTDLIDKSRSQVVEAIAAEVSSSFTLHIDKGKYDKVFSEHSNVKNIENMRILPEAFSTIPALFRMINGHTKKLVESEIKYWSETEYIGAEDYVQSMEDILDYANGCKDGECVMRIGQGSGWRFMTGAWTEGLSNFESVVVPASRPRNQDYIQYVFPKTRRIDDLSYPFGFVKLSMI